MPTISQFYGMYIQMSWNDHAPAHFHVRYADSKATVGKLPLRSLRVVCREQPNVLF